MPQATFVQEGVLIDYTPGGAVAAGDVVIQDQLVGVAPLPIAANELGQLQISGVFSFTKAAGDGGIAAGALCYWDDAENVAKTNAEAGANPLIGKAIKAAATGDTTVLISMNQ